MNESDLKGQLEDIKQQVEDTDRLPVPTLNIIGEEHLEAHWQSLLVYFLEESNPHGFGTDVLVAFLEAVDAHPVLPNQRNQWN
ncbi:MULTISPECIES: PD-(D/E)XK nuclease family protein [Halobacteriales]|uniref:PD-(D/E)XK nuclease family protein n=1 Tax=Halobacteriales TaxID=2235 RepID=UPI000FE4254C